MGSLLIDHSRQSVYVLHLRCQALWLLRPASRGQSWDCLHSADIMATTERTTLHTQSCPRNRQACRMLDNKCLSSSPSLSSPLLSSSYPHWTKMPEATHLTLGVEKMLRNKPCPAPGTASLSAQICTENGASFINARFNSHFSVLRCSSPYNIYYVMKTGMWILYHQTF